MIVSLMILSGSCTTTVKRSNDKEDMDKSKLVCSKFYAHIELRDFEKACALIKSGTSDEENMKLLLSIHDLRGDILDVVTDEVGTDVVLVNGEIESIDCTLEVNGSYEKGKTRETLILEGKSFDSLKIVGYHFTLK